MGEPGPRDRGEGQDGPPPNERASPPPGGRGPRDPRQAELPPWSKPFLRNAALWLILAIASGIVLAGITDALLRRLAVVIQILAVSLFLSFAIEPAVGYLARRGWRRGAATGLVFLAVLLVIAGLVALLAPAVVSGAKQLIATLPQLVNNLARYLKPLGITLDTAHIEDQVRRYAGRVVSGQGTLLGGVLRIATGIAGGVFEALAIAFFAFYMVAQGPQMRRAILGQFPPERQRRIVFIWEQAISQTGGYFYSRLLLAIINGALMYAVLAWRAVPFAVPLALFVGFVSEFIPVVGTYIAGALPVLVALLHEPLDALIVLIWIVVYQQIENYLLSPRLTEKTMSLSAPVAFAAALIGAALGGVLFALLALPTAGVIQAAYRAYGRYYEVVESDMTVVPGLAPEKPEKERPRRPWWRRWRR